MLTALADRTISAPDGLYTDVSGKDLLISYPSTISGTITTSDLSSPAGFAVVATDELGATQTTTTATDGTYSITVMPGYTYTVTAKKSGYVTMPGPRTVNVALGNHAYTGIDFTAAPATITGIVMDSVTGQPIYNAIVQSGVGGAAVVTGADGSYSLPAEGCGGVELFGDALGYHCKNYFVTRASGA